jgi:hypothetical protein
MICSDSQHTTLFDQAAGYASACRDTIRERPQRPEAICGHPSPKNLHGLFFRYRILAIGLPR